MQMSARRCIFECVHIARVSWSICRPGGHVVAELLTINHAGVGEVEVVAGSEK